MARVRNKTRDLDPDRQFNAVVSSDNHKQDFAKTKSLRSGFALDAQIKTLKAVSNSLELVQRHSKDLKIDTPVADV